LSTPCTETDPLSVVCKGVVDNALVTVQKLISQVNELIANKVIIQSRVAYKNRLRLIGCCVKVDNFMLVYEFFFRGSSHDILHCGTKAPLNFMPSALTMVAESAQGSAYVHS
jgi:hypothetical protein